MKRRRWTAEEDAEVRRLYATHGADAIGRRLGRTARSVYARVERLGLMGKQVRWGPDQDEALRRINGEGGTDSRVARVVGVCRRTVRLRREAMGLPCNQYSAESRAKVLQGVVRQLERLGHTSLVAARRASWVRLARERGWPETIGGRTVCHRHVQILDLLYERGPQTKRGIAEALGMKSTGAVLHNARRGGCYLAELIQEGLVVNLGRIVRGEGRGRSVCLYSLSLDVERNRPDEQ